MVSLRTLLLVGGTLLLVGCGQDNDGAPSAGPASLGTWDATNACAILDKAKVGDIAGSAVTATRIDGVTPARDGMAALSTCTYTLTDGSAVGLLTRAAEDGEGIDAAIAGARTGGGVTDPPETIANLGRAAFWTPALNSLQVFLDDRRYVAINLSTPKPGTDPRAVVRKLAEAIR